MYSVPNRINDNNCEMESTPCPEGRRSHHMNVVPDLKKKRCRSGRVMNDIITITE